MYWCQGIGVCMSTCHTYIYIYKYINIYISLYIYIHIYIHIYLYYIYIGKGRRKNSHIQTAYKPQKAICELTYFSCNHHM